MIDLLRCVLRLPDEMIARIDEIASVAGTALRCTVPRAALLAWLDIAEEVNPAQVIEAIRAALVKTGRKPQ